MWLILQADKPDDWVIATGVTTSVRDFVIMAFKVVGINIEFKGSGINEKGYVISCANQKYQIKEGTNVVSIDPRYFRPTEVDILIGDASKAKKELGWKLKYDLSSLIDEMVKNDLKLIS